MKRYVYFSAALATFAQPSMSTAQTDSAGSAYRVPVYSGPVLYPDFNGRQRDWRGYRTRLRNAVKDGIRTGGKYAVAVWGCGTHCVNTVLVDVSTGDVVPWLRSGEDMYVDIKEMHPDSELVRTTWDSDQKCYGESVRIRSGHLQIVEMTELKPSGCPGMYIDDGDAAGVAE